MTLRKPPNSTKRSGMRSLLLLGTSLLLLPGCGQRITTTEPVRVHANECVISWLEHAETPACVVDWLDKVDRAN